MAPLARLQSARVCTIFLIFRAGFAPLPRSVLYFTGQASASGHRHFSLMSSTGVLAEFNSDFIEWNLHRSQSEIRSEKVCETLDDNLMERFATIFFHHVFHTLFHNVFRYAFPDDFHCDYFTLDDVGKILAKGYTFFGLPFSHSLHMLVHRVDSYRLSRVFARAAPFVRAEHAQLSVSVPDKGLLSTRSARY